MKFSLKSLSFFLMLQLVVMNTTFASHRVDLLLSDDNQEALDSLANKKIDVATLKSGIEVIENRLSKRQKGQSTYFKVEKIVGSAILIAIVIGSYKAYFPPGFRATLSAYLSVNAVSRGMVKLNEDDIKKLNADMEDYKKRIKTAEDNLKIQIRYYCSSGVYHQLCY